MRWQAICVASLCTLIVVPAFAQNPAASKTHNAICTFADGKQMRVSYAPLAAGEKKDLPKDKIWTPGDQPMNLFTQAEIAFEGKTVPPGAYSMFLIPGNNKWTVIVNKDVTAGDKYDPAQDLLRASMQIGQLSDAQPFQLGFAQMGPKQCSLRIYYGKVGAWTEFDEQ